MRMDFIKNSLLNTLFRGRLTLLPNEPQRDKPSNGLTDQPMDSVVAWRPSYHSKIIVIKESSE